VAYTDSEVWGSEFVELCALGVALLGIRLFCSFFGFSLRSLSLGDKFNSAATPRTLLGVLLNCEGSSIGDGNCCSFLPFGGNVSLPYGSIVVGGELAFTTSGYLAVGVTEPECSSTILSDALGASLEPGDCILLAKIG
jgi:hypothetical protein